jgi:hypothetical protein
LADTATDHRQRFGDHGQRGGGFLFDGDHTNRYREKASTAQNTNSPGVASAQSITRYSPGNQDRGGRICALSVRHNTFRSTTSRRQLHVKPS